MTRISRYGAAALAVIVAGLLLAFLFAPIQLTDLEEEGDRFGKSAVFLHEGKEVFPVSVTCAPPDGPDQALLIVALGDREGIRIDSVAIAVKCHGKVYLMTPGDYPPVRFRQFTGSGYGSVLEIPDTGIQGDGAMTISFLIQPRPDDTENPTVDIDAGLSETSFPWRRYEAQYRVVIDV
jgi:hypothetical protein